jgi:PAS domain S-box-containing protein
LVRRPREDGFVRSLPTSLERVISDRDEILRRSTQPASHGSSLADAIAGQLRAIGAASNVGVVIVGADHTFTWVNSALAALVDRPADELIGKTFEDITHPDDLRFDAQLAKLLFAGTLDTFQMRKRYLRADGTAVPALLTANVLRGPDREILFALATIESPPPATTAEDVDSGQRAAEHLATSRRAPIDGGLDEVDRIRRAMLG